MRLNVIIGLRNASNLWTEPGKLYNPVFQQQTSSSELNSSKIETKHISPICWNIHLRVFSEISYYDALHDFYLLCQSGQIRRHHVCQVNWQTAVKLYPIERITTVTNSRKWYWKAMKCRHTNITGAIVMVASLSSVWRSSFSSAGHRSFGCLVANQICRLLSLWHGRLPGLSSCLQMT